MHYEVNSMENGTCRVNSIVEPNSKPIKWSWIRNSLLCKN